MNKEDFFLLGRISKIYGKEGALIIQAPFLYQEIAQEEEAVFIEIDDYLVPFFVEWSQSTSDKEMRLKFEDTTSPEEAQEFVGKSVFLPNYLKGVDNGLEFSSSEIIGFLVIDSEHGEVGVVEEVLDLPQQEVLRVRSGEKDVLIPVVGEIITSFDSESRKIHIAAPEGLIDLYLD